MDCNIQFFYNPKDPRLEVYVSVCVCACACVCVCVCVCVIGASTAMQLLWNLADDYA